VQNEPLSELRQAPEHGLHVAPVTVDDGVGNGASHLLFKASDLSAAASREIAFCKLK